MKFRPKSRAEAQTDNDIQPSKVTNVYWLWAERKVGTYPDANENCGKGLIFVPQNAVDDVWARIRNATQAGRLGNSAKVATAKPNPNATNPDITVICVYTYDWTDAEDVSESVKNYACWASRRKYLKRQTKIPTQGST